MRMAANERKLDPSDRGHRLVHELIRAVDYRLRVPTGWNGVVYQTPAPGLLSRAGRSWNGETNPLYDWDSVIVHDDRSLTVRGDVMGHVLSARAGRLAIKDNFRAHQSMLRLVHAAVTLSEHERKYDPRETRAEDAASEALTVGLSQDWALDRGKQHNTHTIVADLDLNKFAPRLTSTRVVDLVPYERTAATAFVTDLAAAARRPRDVTHRELVGTHPAERWNQIGDWLIDSNLQGVISPEARTQLRRELVQIAHANYLEVVRIPQRLADMPRNSPVERVQFAAAMRDRGSREGKNTLLRLNMHIKGAQVNWQKRGPELERIERAANELGVPADELRKFINSQTGPTSPGGGPTVSHERPAEHGPRGTGQQSSGPTR